MESILKAIDQLYEEALVKIDEDWKKALGTGALAAGLVLNPMATGDAQATTAVHQTVGQQNNNPINLKAFEEWQGMTGKDKQGHAIFKSLDLGIRASYKNIKNHIGKNPNQTLSQYLHVFAEKNSQHEADFIAKHLGISPETQIKNIRPEDMLVPMAQFETKMKLSREQILKVKEEFTL